MDSNTRVLGLRFGRYVSHPRSLRLLLPQEAGARASPPAVEPVRRGKEPLRRSESFVVRSQTPVFVPPLRGRDGSRPVRSVGSDSGS